MVLGLDCNGFGTLLGKTANPSCACWSYALNPSRINGLMSLSAPDGLLFDSLVFSREGMECEDQLLVSP